jgi:hypothetical protein
MWSLIGQAVGKKVRTYISVKIGLISAAEGD